MHYCYIILRNVEGKSEVILLENSRTLSPWRPLDFLSICLGMTVSEIGWLSIYLSREDPTKKVQRKWDKKLFEYLLNILDPMGNECLLCSSKGKTLEHRE